MKTQKQKDPRRTHKYLPLFVEKICKYVYRERMEEALIFLKQDIAEHKKLNECGYTVEVIPGNYTIDLYRALTVKMEMNYMKRIQDTEGREAFLQTEFILSDYFPSVSRERFELEQDNHRQAFEFITECGKESEYRTWLAERANNGMSGLRYLFGEEA